MLMFGRFQNIRSTLIAVTYNTCYFVKCFHRHIIASTTQLFVFAMITLDFDFFFFFQAEDGIRDKLVTGVQTCALPISRPGERGPRTVEGGCGPRGARRAAGEGGEARPRQGARADGDPPRGPGPRRRARLVPNAREARRAPRASGAVDGDERRVRGGDRGGGDDGARRDGDLRTARGRAPVVRAAGRRGAGAPPSEASL